LTLPAKPTDSDSEWALVGKHSLGAGGSFSLDNVTDQEGEMKTGTTEKISKGDVGPEGIMNVHVTTATLPSWVGFQLVNEFKFYDDCNVHVLNSTFGDAKQTVWFYRLPELTEVDNQHS
jgi:hypothetical protein